MAEQQNGGHFLTSEYQVKRLFNQLGDGECSSILEHYRILLKDQTVYFMTVVERWSADCV